jgi:hypothetical protein
MISCQQQQTMTKRSWAQTLAIQKQCELRVFHHERALTNCEGRV